MKVSALILTFNEEQNIPSCLAALSWCDDIVVLDSGSSDRTVEIARAHGVRILVRPFDNFANQRNFGLEQGQLRNEWVLHLDADEIVTREFIDELAALAPAPGTDAWRVPSKTMLFGRWLRYAGMYPTYQVRIGHRERLRFKQVGHGQQEDLSPDRVATFPAPYLHYNFSHGVRRWLEKHVKYAQDEAKVILEHRAGVGTTQHGKDAVGKRRALKAFASQMPLWLRPAARMFYLLVLKQGIRDGRAGFFYAWMMAVYEGMIAVCVYDAMLGGLETRDNGQQRNGAGDAPAKRAAE